MKRFGYEQACNELDTENHEGNLRRMENVMTLDSLIHLGFCRMFLWLEEVPGEVSVSAAQLPSLTEINSSAWQSNTYYVRLEGSMTRKDWDIPEEIVTVTFTPHTGDPLPSPAYLRIHAACCRVANMSGAAEYLNAVADETEETGILNELESGGTSADAPPS